MPWDIIKLNNRWRAEDLAGACAATGGEMIENYTNVVAAVKTLLQYSEPLWDSLLCVYCKVCVALFFVTSQREDLLQWVGDILGIHASPVSMPWLLLRPFWRQNCWLSHESSAFFSLTGVRLPWAAFIALVILACCTVSFVHSYGKAAGQMMTGLSKNFSFWVKDLFASFDNMQA